MLSILSGSGSGSGSGTEDFLTGLSDSEVTSVTGSS